MERIKKIDINKYAKDSIEILNNFMRADNKSLFELEIEELK